LYRLDFVSCGQRLKGFGTLTKMTAVLKSLFYTQFAPLPPPCRCDPTRVMASSFLIFLDHTQRRTTVSRTLLDESLARRRDLCMTTHNPHNRQISMPPVGFESTISAGERPQTYALDRAATGTGLYSIYSFHFDSYFSYR